MKKDYSFLLILVVFLLIVGYSLYSGGPNDIANEVQILYKEKSQYLNENSDIFFIWEQEVDCNSISKNCTIEKDEKGNWQYYKDDYQRISFNSKEESIHKIMNMLYTEYEVYRIVITDDSIWYYISNDALIYSKKDITNEDKAFIKHLKDNWYYFKFPYGI